MLHAVLFLEAILEVLEEFGWNNEESVLIDVFLLLRRWDGVAFLRFRPEVGEYFERGRSDILIDVFSDLGHHLISFCIGGGFTLHVFNQFVDELSDGVKACLNTDRPGWRGVLGLFGETGVALLEDD